MDNQNDLEGLLRSKDALEQLVTRHFKGQKVKKKLPKQLENEFWHFNIDRTRSNAIQFFGQGVITYIIYVLLILPTNYLIISDSEHFAMDFAFSILSLYLVGMALFCFGCLRAFEYGELISIKPPVRLCFLQLSAYRCYYLVFQT